MKKAEGQERLSAMTGIAAVALWVVGVLVIGGGHVGFPGGLPEEVAEDVLAFYTAETDRVTIGSWAFMLGALCFVWFVARLSAALGNSRPDPATESGTRLATGTGVVTGVLLLLSGAAAPVTALGAPSLDVAAAQALDGVGGVFFIGAQMTGVVMLSALALLARRTGALPHAWSVATLALAAWLAVLPIGWAGLIVGVPLWTLGTVALLIRPGAPQRAAVTADTRTQPGMAFGSH